MNPRSWREEVADALERERAARALLPELAPAPTITKTCWRDAANPLGFAPDVEELSTGRVNRLRLRHDRVVLGAAADSGRLRVAELLVELTPYRAARARLEHGALVVHGSWREVDAAQIERIVRAVDALVGELPRHHPPPPDAWALVGRLPRGPGDTRIRCLVCGERLTDKLRLALGHHPRERPEPGTSADKDWQALRIEAGLVHLPCAATEMGELLRDAIANCEWAEREPGLGRFRNAAPKITRGGLVRCAACSQPLQKRAWRLERSDGPSPLHIQCARASAPGALDQALTRTPAGFSETDP